VWILARLFEYLPAACRRVAPQSGVYAVACIFDQVALDAPWGTTLFLLSIYCSFPPSVSSRNGTRDFKNMFTLFSSLSAATFHYHNFAIFYKKKFILQ
jgi:hypothetical protein